jgi:hypothetical protein
MATYFKKKKEGHLTKRRILLRVFVLGAMVALSMFFLLGTAGAANTGTVTPSVEVDSTLSLSLSGTVSWADKLPGDPCSGTVNAAVVANTPWVLAVQATDGYPGTNELTDETHRIVSSYFKYSSAASTTSPPNGTGVGLTQFDGSNATSVWSGGTPTAGATVDVSYNLTIPPMQPPGTYTATHTYTLTSTS